MTDLITLLRCFAQLSSERTSREVMAQAAEEIERLKMECIAYRRMLSEKSEEKAYWAREFYRLREHCERVTGTSPVDIGPQND